MSRINSFPHYRHAFFGLLSKQDKTDVKRKRSRANGKKIAIWLLALLVLAVSMFYANISIANPLSVPYIHQLCDTPDDFNGKWACGATSAVMILAYHGILDPWPFSPSYCSPTPRTSNYGQYVSNVYSYNNYPFEIGTREPSVGQVEGCPNGDFAYGAYGFIHRPKQGHENDCDTSDGPGYAKADYIKEYFELHGLVSGVKDQTTGPPTETLVKAEIDAGRPVLASTKLWNAGHLVVIKGYTYEGISNMGSSCASGCYRVNDPWPFDTPSYDEWKYRKGENYRYTWAEMQTGSKWIVTAASVPPEKEVSDLSLKWPLNGTLSDRTITLRFGDDWVDYCDGLVKQHAGLDVTAIKDEDVYAAESGTVKIAETDPYWGGWVTVEHTNSIPVFTTAYWHVNPLISAGAPVTKGQKIATIADLGSNTHFHFGVRLSSYSNISNRGALPQTDCEGDPAFPEYFIDPEIISYESNPLPDIKANGSDVPLTIPQGDLLTLIVSLNPGSHDGEDADWWVAVYTPFDTPYDCFYFDCDPDGCSWEPGLSVTYQGPLFNLPQAEVLNISGLSAGTYKFYFGIDTNMNGILDFDWLYYDGVVVNVIAPLDTSPPSVPTGLIATAISSSQIDLSWTASADDIGVEGYNIYRDGVYLKSVTTTSASDTGLSPDTQYCYTVSAYDGAGNESDQSSQACATTSSLTSTPPTASITNPSNGSTFTEYVGDTISFQGSGTDSDGYIVSYKWDFGNGSTSTQQNPSHSYSSAGTYTVTLTVTDDGGATGTDSISVQVVTPITSGVLQVTPGDGLVSSGPQSGPFSPSSKTYTLSNTGGSSINWTASKTKNWISLSIISGTLSPDGSTTVTVSINNNANSLTPNSYFDTVTFTNTTNGSGNTTRSVSLTVTGDTAGQITIGPTSLSFGNVEVGSCETAVVSIQHVTGTGPATGTVSASPNPPFSISSGSSFSVSSGSAANVTVQFCPSSSGTFSGTITVSSSATFTGTNTVTLTGTGSFPTNPPTVTTGTYQVISSSSAQLFGTVNPNGLSTTGWFQWGTTTSYGNTTNTESLGNGTSTVQMLHTISSLSPNTTYHFRGVAQNSAGTSYGTDMSFTTPPPAVVPPTVTTEAATSVSSSSATLNGTVNPNGSPVTAWFEWGTNTSYGNTSPTFSGGSGTTPVPMGWAIGSLSPNTTYHFRAVAQNSAGTVHGNDRTFTTAPSNPVERITNGSFSSGTSGWTLVSDFWAGTNLTNYRTSPGYASGGVDSNGYAKNNAYGYMYQTVTIPSNATSATLSFWYNITSQESGSTPYDVLNVTIQSPTGGYLATVATFSNLNKGTLGVYSQKTFGVTPYKGQTIRIHFLGTTDGSNSTTFRIDDVSLMSDGN